jgi:hypothetical protein
MPIICRNHARSLRVAVLVFVVFIVIFITVAFVFLLVFFLLRLLAKEDISGVYGALRFRESEEII